MPGCAACNASKKRCPGGVKGCLVEKERKEKRETAAREGAGEKQGGGGPAPSVKSPPQKKKATPAEPRRAQQPVTAGHASTFAEILDAPRAAPPDANDPRVWKESSAVQALLDFPEADQPPGACPDCSFPMTAHAFWCEHWRAS